jgi:hypothetical protein
MQRLTKPPQTCHNGSNHGKQGQLDWVVEGRDYQGNAVRLIHNLRSGGRHDTRDYKDNSQFYVVKNYDSTLSYSNLK